MATTTNLGLTLPTVSGSNNTWGDENNALHNGVDAVFAAAGNGTSVGLNVGSGKTLTLAGTGTVTGTLSASGGTMVLPQGASSAPTAEGSVGWDTDDNLLKIGDGSAAQTFTPSVSGTYTPTIANDSNLLSSTAQLSTYLRVGNIVTVSGAHAFESSASGIIIASVTLPVASNLANLYDCTGSGAAYSGGSFYGCRIYGDTAGNRAYFLIESYGGAANNTVYFTFQYRVI